MPLDNYFNPDVYKPNAGYTPSAGLAGFLSANEYAQAQKAKSLQLQLIEDSLHRQQAETADYDQAAPERQALRGSHISQYGLDKQFYDNAARNPDYTRARTLGAIGQFQTQEAAGREALGTVQGKVNATNLESIARQIESAGRNLELMHASNPLLGEAEYRGFVQKLPKEIQGNFPPTYDSKIVPQLIQHLSQAITNSPSHRQKMAELKQQGDTAIKIGEGHDEASKYAADQRLEAAWAKMPSGSKDKIESVINQVLIKMLNGEPLTDGDKNAFMAAQQIMYNIRSAAGYNLQDPAALKAWIMGYQGAPRGAPAPVAPSGGDLQSQALKQLIEQAGEQYQPDIYDYRINPQTRQLEKKRKNGR